MWWLWCWLTVGLFVMFQVSSRHVIVSDSMESWVRLSPCEQGPRRRRRRRSFRLQDRVMCTLVSGGADNAAPFFFSTVYRCCCCCWLVGGWWCCCCCTTILLPVPHRRHNQPYPGIDPQRFGNNSNKRVWDGDLQTELSFNRSSTTHPHCLNEKHKVSQFFKIPSC